MIGEQMTDYIRVLTAGAVAALVPLSLVAPGIVLETVPAPPARDAIILTILSSSLLIMLAGWIQMLSPLHPLAVRRAAPLPHRPLPFTPNRTMRKMRDALFAGMDGFARPIILTDSNGRITHLNESAFLLIGSDTVIGESIENILRWKDEQPVIRALQARSSAETRHEGIAALPDGRSICLVCRITPVFGRRGRLIGSILVISRIERRQEETADGHRQTIEQLSRLIIESSTEAICLMDAARAIRYTNPAFEQMTGYNDTDAAGRSFDFINSGWHKPDFFDQLFAIADHQGTWQGELWCRRKNGDIFPAAVSVLASRLSDVRSTYYIGQLRDMTRNQTLEAQVHHLTSHDPLTGLPNRMMLHQRLAHACRFADEHQSGVAVMLIDIDDFRLINETFGHEDGDQLLKTFADRIRTCLRATDTVVRFGGDEFMAVLPNLRSQDDSRWIAEKIIRLLHEPIPMTGLQVSLSASIGISYYPDHDTQDDRLLTYASIACSRAKEAGKDRYLLYR